MSAREACGGPGSVAAHVGAGCAESGARGARVRLAWAGARRFVGCVRRELRTDSPVAAAAWALAALVLLAVLAWFFVCSPYGAPAAPVYAEF